MWEVAVLIRCRKTMFSPSTRSKDVRSNVVRLDAPVEYRPCITALATYQSLVSCMYLVLPKTRKRYNSVSGRNYIRGVGEMSGFFSSFAKDYQLEACPCLLQPHRK
jgi:hypothetical protein